ncbi:restriction endonuclease subunit S, partial [Parasutterella excrementihominis]|uniref:restriction endonuclease subunit S n=1 Tax=Parasutterella excrementihominis TaxID=487175 RepID=UPI0022E0F9B3
IITPLSENIDEVKWGEVKLSDLFRIEKTKGFNTNLLSEGDEFDYVTRSSFNNGILQSTGKVQEQNLNPSKCWSLGLLQMDFFYRERPWYAGQFIRKIIP